MLNMWMNDSPTYVHTCTILRTQGVLPNVQRACVVAAVELPTYDTAKRQLIQHGFMDDGIYCHFVYVKAPRVLSIKQTLLHLVHMSMLLRGSSSVAPHPSWGIRPPCAGSSN